MQMTVVLALSVFIQFVSACLALRLIPATGTRKAWIALAVAILLIACRDCITIFLITAEKMNHPTNVARPVAEWITLAVSVFMLAGMYWIAPLVLSMRRPAEALGEIEEQYRTLFEESRDAVYVTDHGGRVIDINQSCLDLFGYSENEMMGMDARRLYVDFSERKKLREALNSTLSHYDPACHMRPPHSRFWQELVGHQQGAVASWRATQLLDLAK